MKKLLILLFIITPLVTMADYISNGFFIVDKHLNFDKTIRSGKCNGIAPYPKLSNQDEELFMRINDEIHDFVELYSICNGGERSHFSVNYDVPNSGTKDFFSILWLTKKDDKLWRIDTLNFNAENSVIKKSAIPHIPILNVFTSISCLIFINFFNNKLNK